MCVENSKLNNSALLVDQVAASGAEEEAATPGAMRHIVSPVIKTNTQRKVKRKSQIFAVTTVTLVLLHAQSFRSLQQTTQMMTFTVA